MNDSLIIKPMLASSIEDRIDELKYPVYVTPKLDGIRCILVGGKALSRNFKPIQNEYVRETLESIGISGLDGELIVPGGFGNTQSGIMSFGGQPEFEYHVFDYVTESLTEPYHIRMVKLAKLCETIKEQFPFVKFVPVQFAGELDHLIWFNDQFVSEGYEGSIIRSPEGPYKCGRSSFKEGYLLKMKPFEDSEARIIGFEEKNKNLNPAEKDAFGRTKRSSAKGGKVPKGILANLVGEDIYNGVVVRVPGFTDELGKEIWENQDKYIDKIFTYRFEKATKDNPRFPRFKGFRHKGDMDEIKS